MIFGGKTKYNGRPPLKDQYKNFIRIWNGKIYSANDSKLLFNYNDWIHLYKHNSGDYFIVSNSSYGDLDYEILSKEKVILMLCRYVTNYDYLEYVKELLEKEFDYVIQ